MGTWQDQRFSVAAALVIGVGANTDDSNAQKDVCARPTIKPLAVLDVVIAVRGCYGWPDAIDSVWRTVAAEARLGGGPLELQAESQNHPSADVSADLALPFLETGSVS
jgi:hypothetical protein